jgi:hypothetical protein
MGYMRVLFGYIVSPGLSILLGMMFMKAIGIHLYNLDDVKFYLGVAYFLSVPLSIPGALAIMSLNRPTVYHCMSLGALVGFTTYWIFFDLAIDYDTLRGGTMTLRQVLLVVTHVEIPEIAIEITACGALAGIIFWFTITCLRSLFFRTSS